MRTCGLKRLIFSVLLTIGSASLALGTTVSVSPTSVTLQAGGDHRLTAYVNGVISTAVVWSVNGTPGGSATVGFIDSTGLYTAPATPPSGWTVTATARSIVSPSASGSCVITVRNPTPLLSSLSPNPLALGAFTLRVTGAHFVPGASLRWNGAPLTTTFNSSTQLTATGTATQTGIVSIIVVNPGPTSVSTPASLTIVSRVILTPTGTRSQPPTATMTRRTTVSATMSPTRTPTRAAPSVTPTTIPSATSTAFSTATMTRRDATPTLTAPPSSPTATATTARTETPRPTPTLSPTAAMPTATPTGFEMMPTPTLVPTAAATGTATTMRTEITATATPIRSLTPSAGTTATARTSATPALAVSVAPVSATLQTGAALQFQATVTGSANQSVTWMVDNTAGGDSTSGTITASGLYTAPSTMPIAGSVVISAVSAADGLTQGTAILQIQDPLALTYGRFLDQATFGPTQPLLAHVAQIGIPAFIDEQFAMPESPWPPLDTAQRSDAVDAFFGNAFAGQDQLRQRVIFALSEIIVEAMNKNTNGDEIVPWLALLSRDAFGNYRTLLEDITLDASMGKYLDLANSGVGGGAANENFPREVMQLFSIGLYQLNLDGSTQVDTHNLPIPTYTQTDVQQMAKALTGWTYGNPNGVPPAWGNYNYYPGPMLPIAAAHNTAAKTILGHTLPANQLNQQDLDGALDIIFNHPNVGPFLATRLSRALVTSNPTPAYIARVAAVFNDNGSGVRGDMQAVIRAILLDPEARNDTPPATFGRLRTPMQHTIALTRALGLDPGPASQFAYLFYNMNEGLLDAASVFGHYSPTYHIPRTQLFGPEFQIYSASDAINRANFFYGLLYNPWPINPALQPFVALAANPAILVNAVDNALLFGRMTAATRTAVTNAVAAMPDNNARVLTALYLTAMSGEHLVQR